MAASPWQVRIAPRPGRRRQSLVARSSGESELYGVVRATCEALETQTLFRDFGKEHLTKVHVDASTAKSIAGKLGLDKIGHLAVNTVWLQHQQVRARTPLMKIHGTVSTADLMTKHLPLNEIEAHLGRLNSLFRVGHSLL